MSKVNFYSYVSSLSSDCGKAAKSLYEQVCSDVNPKQPIPQPRTCTDELDENEYFDKQNRLQKTLTADDIKQVNGYWTTLKQTMTNVQTNHKTIYEVKNLKYDEKVNESYFTVSALEREQIK